MARIGHIEDETHRPFIRKKYGEDAPKRFQLDGLLDEMLELGFSVDELKALLGEDKSLDEEIAILQQAKAAKQTTNPE